MIWLGWKAVFDLGLSYRVSIRESGDPDPVFLTWSSVKMEAEGGACLGQGMHKWTSPGLLQFRVPKILHKMFPFETRKNGLIECRYTISDTHSSFSAENCVLQRKTRLFAIRRCLARLNPSIAFNLMNLAIGKNQLLLEINEFRFVWMDAVQKKRKLDLLWRRAQHQLPWEKNHTLHLCGGGISPPCVAFKPCPNQWLGVSICSDFRGNQ